SPGYRDALTKLEAASAARVAAEKRRDSASVALDEARAAFGPASDSVRRAFKGWEDSTYREYQQATEYLVRRAAQPVMDTTDADGGTTLRITRGRWWIYARAWDVLDPNAEWYWNVPVTGDSIVLSPANGRRRPRY
ncbi:MAG TPA: hypothetical protein VFX50_13965, partial [Gemmatimonadales bacterium]|nr:hypothetical protein [Gemmatimonadales bacterium]